MKSRLKARKNEIMNNRCKGYEYHFLSYVHMHTHNHNRIHNHNHNHTRPHQWRLPAGVPDADPIRNVITFGKNNNAWDQVVNVMTFGKNDNNLWD